MCYRAYRILESWTLFIDVYFHRLVCCEWPKVWQCASKTWFASKAHSLLFSSISIRLEQHEIYLESKTYVSTQVYELYTYKYRYNCVDSVLFVLVRCMYIIVIVTYVQKWVCIMYNVARLTTDVSGSLGLTRSIKSLSTHVISRWHGDWSLSYRLRATQALSDSV